MLLGGTTNRKRLCKSLTLIVYCFSYTKMFTTTFQSFLSRKFSSVIDHFFLANDGKWSRFGSTTKFRRNLFSGSDMFAWSNDRLKEFPKGEGFRKNGHQYKWATNKCPRTNRDRKNGSRTNEAGYWGCVQFGPINSYKQVLGKKSDEDHRNILCFM